MPTCSICHVDFVSVQFLFIHLKHIHSLGSKSTYACGEHNCFRSFPSKNSFKKHLQLHSFSNNSDSVSEATVSKNVVNEVNTDKVDAEELNCSELPSTVSSDYCHGNDDSLYLSFKKILNNNLLSFICKLYAESSFSRKDVQLVILSIQELLKEPLKILKQFIVENVSEYEFLINFITGFENLFSGFDTEYLRLGKLDKIGHYIKPTECILGSNDDRILPKNFSFQFVSIGVILQKFFELPNVLTETLKNIENLNSTSSSAVSHIVQTDFWKKKCDTNKVTLPLYIYYDEFESGNPLGSHSGIHKIGGIYCSVPTIPDKFSSRLENIFMFQLFHGNDLKKFGNSKIFSNLIEECNNLKTEGITVNVSDSLTRVYFSVALLLGDNLGLNTMLGFTESFRANFFCRFCKCNREETQTMVVEQTEKLRNRNNYDDDVKLSNISATGIKESSVWNNLNSFHVTENFSVDIAHDIFEGIALFDTVELLYQFIIVSHLFSVDQLNDRLRFFNFGTQNVNKPPLFSLCNIRKKHINMSCAEMKTFIQYAGLIFADLVPVNNKFWELYILLRKMLDIILSDSVLKDDIIELRDLISKHHSAYLNLFSIPLKPKHHILIHYPFIIEKIGPVKKVSSLRYESKHREFKKTANVVSSRVNITRTLAVKNQLKLCLRFISEKGFTDNIDIGKEKKIQNIIDVLPNFESSFPSFMTNFEKSFIVKKMFVNDVLFKSNDVIIINRKKPELGLIKFILVNDINKVAFIYYELTINKFNTHLYSYEVSVTDTVQAVHLEDLHFSSHVVITNHFRKTYVTLL